MVIANATFVMLNPETLTFQVFQVGDEIPDWALAKVTNPDILGDGEEAVHDFDTGDVDVVNTEDGTEEEDAIEDDGVDLPNDSWKKAEIVDFLTEREVEMTGSETKDELLALVHGED